MCARAQSNIYFTTQLMKIRKSLHFLRRFGRRCLNQLESAKVFETDPSWGVELSRCCLY